MSPSPASDQPTLPFDDLEHRLAGSGEPDTFTSLADSATVLPFTVSVVRSARRKRSVGAQLLGSVLTITVPAWMSRAEELHWIDVMSGRFARKLSADRIDLVERAATLARRHDLSRPREISWVGNMGARWGSCTPSTGVVRLSDRLAAFPDWVIDYVIVHELAHLEVGDHSTAFWQLVTRYPKTERAIGYLMAKSGDEPEL
jgi:hypothetical protein